MPVSVHHAQGRFGHPFSAMTPEPGTCDNTEYLLLTPKKLTTGSKKELLAVLKKLDPTGFAPQHMPELRIALLNIAYTQNPTLKARLRRASSNKSLPKQLGDQDLPPKISTACSTSPSTPVTRSPHALSDERPSQHESAKYQSPGRSLPNEQEMKQQLDRHDRTLKKRENILEERERQHRQCALVLYGLKELDVQPPRDSEFKDDPLTQLLASDLPPNDIDSEWTSNKRLGSFSPDNRKPRPVLIGFPSIEDKHTFLQLSKQLRQRGLRLDDWLTKRQEEETDALSADFQALKGKGYKPFLKGSVLMYRCNHKACVCQKDKADTVPPAL